METEYVKVVGYGAYTDVRKYSRRPMGGRPRKLPDSNEGALLPLDGSIGARQAESNKVRSEGNARSATRSFRMLVAANLVGRDVPLLITLTYGANFPSLDRAREDFKSFAKRASAVFGEGFRYVCVVEFQERGAPHFHALCWGLKKAVYRRERRTRMVAKLWRQGFADVKKTDGKPALAGYMAKYFKDSFTLPEFFGRRVYTASRNILRPVIVKDAILAAHFGGYTEPDLSTAHVAQEAEYDTLWLGRCEFKRYLTLQTNARSNDPRG